MLEALMLRSIPSRGSALALCIALAIPPLGGSLNAQAPFLHATAGQPWAALPAASASRPLATGEARGASYATTTFLFYRSDNGAGVLTSERYGVVTTRSTYHPHSFALGWTSVAALGTTALFYNSRTGAGAEGPLQRGTFSTSASFAAGAFARGWTHITKAGSGTLFYNATTGEGALNYNPSTQYYAAGSFATGWTHVVDAGSHLLLFYNAHTGAGAIGRVTYRSDEPGGWLIIPDRVVTTRVYQPGSFLAGWTHVVATSGGILFYNAQTGGAAIGNVRHVSGGDQFVTENSFATAPFPTGWTHVASGGGDLLFYNARTGEGAVAAIDRSVPATPTLRILRYYGANSFAPGWTHVVGAVDVVI
jgi:hypothetical protein